MQGIWTTLFTLFTFCVPCKAGFLAIGTCSVIIGSTYCRPDDPVNDGKWKGADDEADEGVENSVFSFLDFASVAGGGDVIDATDDDINYANEASDCDDGINDTSDGVDEIAVFFTTGGVFDFFWYIIVITDAGCVCWGWDWDDEIKTGDGESERS